MGLNGFGLASGDPKWSSWALERWVTSALFVVTLEELYLSVNTVLQVQNVPLTQTVAQFLKDLVILGFTRYGSKKYRGIRWGWRNAALSANATPAQCYFLLHALPLDVMTFESAAAILETLRGTPFEQEAIATLDI